MRISDWSSDVCSSDLPDAQSRTARIRAQIGDVLAIDIVAAQHIGRQAVRETAGDFTEHRVDAQRQVERFETGPVEAAALEGGARPRKRAPGPVGIVRPEALAPESNALNLTP